MFPNGNARLRVIFPFVSDILCATGFLLRVRQHFVHKSVKYLACPILLHYNRPREENVCCEVADKPKEEKEEEEGEWEFFKYTTPGLKKRLFSVSFCRDKIASRVLT